MSNRLQDCLKPDADPDKIASLKWLVSISTDAELCRSVQEAFGEAITEGQAANLRQAILGLPSIPLDYRSLDE